MGEERDEVQGQYHPVAGEPGRLAFADRNAPGRRRENDCAEYRFRRDHAVQREVTPRNLGGGEVQTGLRVELPARFCSARLQAGTLVPSTCPPEGGRYMR